MISFLDLKAPYLELKEEIGAAIERVVSSGWYILGPEVDAFESEFAAYCEASHCVGLANGLDTILQIGKEGIGDNLVQQANEALEARELIKGRVLESAMLTPREACQTLARLTRSEPVQVIGTKFVLYRESHSKEKKDKIVLVKDRKKPNPN